MKKIFIILSAFFLGLTFVNAQVNYQERTLDNLGVNKNITITDANRNNILRTPLVDASEKIYDFADVLDDTTKQTLLNKMNAFIEKSNMDIVIVLIDKELSDDEIEDYAADFYDYNDFGLNYSYYSGILLIRNVNSYNRFFNIYTFGEAQLYYTYDRCESILDDIYDDIKADRYLEGLTTYISEAEYYFEQGKVSDDQYIDDNGFVKTKYKVPYLLSAIISGTITTITMCILVGKNKMVKKELKANTYLDRNSIKYNKQNNIFLHSHTSSYTINTDSGGSGGGSHSGSSGMGHSGGGGRHG